MGKKIYWITDNRFKWISLLLFFMFIIFMTLLYLKADEITHNPCEICAQKSGEMVICSLGSQARIYYPNLTTERKENYNAFQFGG